MLTTYFIALFVTLNVFYLILGLIASRSVHSTADYFLAGKNLGLIPVTLTLVATQIGGGMLTGTAQQAYTFGFYGLLYTLGMCIGLTILGLGLASRLQGLNVGTTAELFEVSYDSPFLRKVASIFSVITMSGILVAQIIASRTILHGVGLSQEWIFIGLWVFIIIYTMTGGLKAVVWTDMAQVLVILGVFGWLLYLSLSSDPKALFNVKNLFKLQWYFFGTKCIDNNTIALTIAMPALFSLIEQDIAQRFFAARSKIVASLSALCSSLILISFAMIPIYFGMKAKVLGLKVGTGSPLIPVLSLLTNDFVVAFALCAIMAAITSTADSVLCAISSNLAQDFEYRFLKSNTLLLAQIITCCVGISAMGASYIIPNTIIDTLISSYSISVCCLLTSLLFAYLGIRGQKYAAFTSILAGLVAFITFSFTPVPFLAIPKEFAALGISFATYILTLFVSFIF